MTKKFPADSDLTSEPAMELYPTAGDAAAHSEARIDPVKKPVDDIGGFCVYIGPNIRGVIQSGTIYSNPKKQVVAELQREIEMHPQIASLIVSDDTLAIDRIKVKTPGNMLHVTYTQLATGQK